MLAMLMVFTGLSMGDCMDAAACRAKDGAGLWLILTPFAGIATFFLVRWLVVKRT